ncbi:hypothetical protein [Streptococcus oralis]|jgi:hypothetical protein|uniref:hypothetical protein n=1 Tax=Streptococcus oralis TaxID=1303 RepID=UPI00228415D2|nr:hypothetical protein [Streptococcus oralis]MCY7088751.1 hypothetical protein [Streptococcus oralis]
MKNEEKKAVDSLLAQKVLEDKRDRELDFVVDLLILAFVVFVVGFSTFGLQPFIEFINKFCYELLY